MLEVDRIYLRPNVIQSLGHAGLVMSLQPE